MAAATRRSTPPETVKRLGATETLIVYRRDQVHMTATEFETDEALAEGIKIKWLRSIKAINGGDLTVEVMKLDENGRPQPTGQLETLQADAVVLAVGQDADSGFLDKIAEIQREPDGTVAVTPNMMTGRQGIFAGGDMVARERTVTTAVGHGKKAARHIDAWLRATVYESPAKTPDRGLRHVESAHLQRRTAVQSARTPHRRANHRFRGGRRRFQRAAGTPRGETLLLVRQLL
jgi:hypothetical protein